MEFNATFIVSAISFIFFTIVMNAIFYKPLTKVVAQRDKFVEDTLEDARVHKAKAESIILDKEKKLNAAKFQAKGLFKSKTDEVKAQKDSMTSEAQSKATQIIDEAKKQFQDSQVEAQKVLDDEVQKLALDISSKILGEV